MKIRNLSKSNLPYPCYSAQIPKTLIEKAFGLTFLNNFETFDGYLIKNCKIIHSFFMSFPFDVVFLDNNFCVVKIYKNFKPFKISKYIKSAKYVLELPENSIEKLNIEINDKFEVKDS